jgi:thiamine-phosphate pyrophosphorylase
MNILIIQPRNAAEAATMARTALNQGYGWLQLSMPGAADQAIVEACQEIIPMCKEADAILVIESAVEAVMTTKVHGVYLRRGDRPAAEVREYLGPHAVIGADASSLDEVMALAKADVDYAGLPDDFTAEQVNEIAAALAAAGADLHLVAAASPTSFERIKGI